MGQQAEALDEEHGEILRARRARMRERRGLRSRAAATRGPGLRHGCARTAHAEGQGSQGRPADGCT